MSARESFETMLTGGHPNSLGRTEEVVALVLGEPKRFSELFACYQSPDAVVRLRVSSAIKRLTVRAPQIVIPWLDRLIGEIGQLDQASAQWSLAEIFNWLKHEMTPARKQGALGIMKRNLEHHGDWIVLNHTMQTLAEWAGDDEGLRQWLVPQLERLSRDPRKSVAKRADKLLKRLT